MTGTASEVDPAPLGDGPSSAPDVCDDAATRTFGLLVEAHARLTRLLDAELAQAEGITLQTFEVLLRIGRSPEGWVTMSQLAGAVALTTGGVTRMADRLERDGLVRRGACPTDRRVVHLELTDAGRAVLDRAFVRHVDGLQRHVRSRLHGVEEAELQRLLDILRSEPV